MQMIFQFRKRILISGLAFFLSGAQPAGAMDAPADSKTSSSLEARELCGKMIPSMLKRVRVCLAEQIRETTDGNDKNRLKKGLSELPTTEKALEECIQELDTALKDPQRAAFAEKQLAMMKECALVPGCKEMQKCRNDKMKPIIEELQKAALQASPASPSPGAPGNGPAPKAAPTPAAPKSTK